MYRILLVVVLVTLAIVSFKSYSASKNEAKENVIPANQEIEEKVSEPEDKVTQEVVISKKSNVLDLSGQNLTKAPAYIFNQENLEELNLSNNKIDGALQAEVRLLVNLRVLDLSNNNFTGVPAEVGQLANLEVLNLANNKLTGLPMELGNPTSIKRIDLRGNAYSKQDLDSIKTKLGSGVEILVD